MVDQDPADAPTLVLPGPGHGLVFAQLVGDPTNELVPVSMTFCVFRGASSTDTLATEPVLSPCLAAGERTGSTYWTPVRTHPGTWGDVPGSTRFWTGPSWYHLRGHFGGLTRGVGIHGAGPET